MIGNLRIWGRLFGLMLLSLVGCEEPNRPPVIGVFEAREVRVNEELRVVLEASDPDLDSLSFTLEPMPAYLAEVESKTPARSVFSWSPTVVDLDEAKPRTHSFVVQVSDGRGGIDSTPLKVRVVPEPSSISDFPTRFRLISP